jgi:hypothetical protein
LQDLFDSGLGMDFKRAIDVAEENARALLPGANELKLEGVIISGRDYEVTLSYYLTGKNPLELSGGKKDGNNLDVHAQGVQGLHCREGNLCF